MKEEIGKREENLKAYKRDKENKLRLIDIDKDTAKEEIDKANKDIEKTKESKKDI